MKTYDLTALPSEVVAYGFDQFPDRLGEDKVGEAIEAIRAGELVECDYDAKVFRLHDNVLATVLRGALREKASDLQQEVRHGERNDVSPEEIDRAADRLTAVFDDAIVVDLSALPDEVVGYAFDQFPDRLGDDAVAREIGDLRAHDQIDRDYDAEEFRLNDTALGSILRGALYEKVDDIAWEVRHGERDDYTTADADRFRRQVRAAFGG